MKNVIFLLTFLLLIKKEGFFLDLKTINKENTKSSLSCVLGSKKEFTIRGYVFDENTKEPIYATISAISGKDTLKTTTDSTDGKFILNIKKRGIYIIKAEAEGYGWQEKGVVIKEKVLSEIDVNFLLRKKFTYSIIKAEVYNLRSMTGIKEAYIYLGDHIKTTDADGIFYDTLKTATYPIKIMKDGYYEYSNYLILKPGVNNYSFPLVPVEK